MEASGGLSVADLVERHTGSRPDLAPVEDPHAPRPHSRAERRVPPPPVRQGRPGEAPRNGHNGAPGHRPGEPAGARWPEQAPEPQRQPRRQQPRGDRPTPPPPNRPPGDVGQRSLANGRRPGDSGPLPQPGGRPPGDVGQRSQANGRPPGDVGQRSQANGRPPGDVGQRSTANGRRPADSGPHSLPGRPPGDVGQRSTANGRRPADSGPHSLPGRPPGDVGQRSLPGGRPPGEVGQRSTANGRRPAPNGRPPGEVGQRSTANGRRPADSGPHSLPGRPPGDEGQRPLPGGRPPENGAPGKRPVPLPPPRGPQADDDPICLTTEMEAIGEDVQKRRSIDHTLARFSAVHDELKAEEREKKAKRKRRLPWQQPEDDLDRLDEIAGIQSIPLPPQEPEPEPEPAPEPKAKKSGKPRTRLQEKKSRKQSRSALAWKVTAAIAAVLVFVATGVAWGFKHWIDSSAQEVDALDPNSAAIQDASAQRGDENFLLVGSDTRAGASVEDGVGDENAVGGARSDTVMIAHVPANRERVVVVSFPRDLEVTRPECEGWDAKTGEYNGKQHPAEEQVKINTAYQIGGPKCVTKTVQELSGLAINHFVGIDFHGFKDMVDAVDGVQVCVEEPLEDEVLGTVVPEAGKNVTLSGDQALNFVRARHVTGDPTSDYGRIIRQQRFLSSLLRKAMSTEVLLNARKLTGFVESFSKSTFGDNIGVEQLFTLGQSLQGMEAGRVTFITVPTVGEANDRGNEELRVDDNGALFEAIRQDTPLPGETGKGADQPKSQPLAGLRQPAGETVDPATLKIQVLNGGNPTTGIAAATADKLAAFGYQIVRVEAADETVETTTIKYGKENEAAARTLASSVPGAKLVEDPASGGALILLVGPGFDGKVQAPGQAGQPTEVPEGLSTVNAGDVSCA
jgi:LCP family protein required for cell wall assembly